MKTRPKLKTGDVCMYSKKVLRRRPMYTDFVKGKNKIRMVVLKVFGDGSDKWDRISCSVTFRPGSRAMKQTFQRDHLWFTGYNINDSKGPRRKQAKSSGSGCFCDWDQIMRGDGHDLGCKDIPPGPKVGR